ncbi:MAG: type II and III secretion system protein [Thiomicrospira sp.]|nr:type II and III secretion system protein [Thiomicrospira sp.]
MKREAPNKLILSGLLVVGLLGCESAVKRDPLVPPLGQEFAYQGHLTTQKKADELVASVPEIVRARPFNPPPKKEAPLALASVSAFNAPAQQVIYEIATKFGYQVDIWQGVEGVVTINAIEQPLPVILERLANQLSLAFQIEDNHLIIKPDRPYWKQYVIDYVNIQRNKTDTIVMNMTVGGAVNAGSSSQGAGSSSVVEIKSEHDFWAALQANLLNMTTDINEVDTALAPSAPATPVTPPAAPEPVAAVPTEETTAGAALAAQVNAISQTTDVSALSAPVAPSYGQAQTTAAAITPRHQSTVMINREAGLVLVYASSRQHKQVAEYIYTLGQTTEKQVLIEASVIEVILSDEYQAGIDWSFGSRAGTNNLANQVKDAGDVATGFFATLAGGLIKAGGKTLDVGASLKMLQQFGDAKVLSSPKIMAINNQSALLKVVDNEVYFTLETTPAVVSSTGVQTSPATYTSTVHTVPVGFMMTVTPFINDEEEISLNIRPTISRIIDYREDPNPDLRPIGREPIISKIPVVREREMETVLKLRNQQTGIIGGLIEDVRDNNRDGVPWLSNVPGLGELFAYRNDTVQKTELVIFIRATIIDQPDIENGDLVQFRGLLEQRSDAKK